MSKTANILALCLILGAWTGESSAEGRYYQWTDEKGTVHLTDTPPPARAQGKVRIHEFRETSSPEGFERPSGKTPPTEPPRSTRSAPPRKPEPLLLPYSRVSVTLYGAAWCGVCRKARTFLQELGVSLAEIDVDKDPAAFRKIQERLGRKTGVPVIDVEGKIFVGFSRKTVAAEIEKQRAPKL